MTLSFANPHVTPDAPASSQPTIGLIGMGEMGRMYARILNTAGWKKICVCDIPSKFEDLKRAYADTPGVTVLPNGYAVSRCSDFIIYSVEAELIDRVVKEYGPSTKQNAVVAGQTSVKTPERTAFEKYLPEDTHIISCHSLHGPTVSPVGQSLILIPHRGPPEALTFVESLLRCFGSRYVYLSYPEHDLVTANTQAVTHAAFLSMGTAWGCSQRYPWEQGLYVGGLETVKVNLTLRIYSNQWHVYAGLAILNPSAAIQINQYAKSATELFKLMLAGGNGTEEDRRAFKDRVEWGREAVFGDTVEGSPGRKKKKHRPILLHESVLDKFSLGKPAPSPNPSLSSSPEPGFADPLLSPDHPDAESGGGRYHPHRQASTIIPTLYRANSNLSLLAMVDSWAHLKINPYKHLSLAATPLFRLFLGVAEHLFLSPSLLRASVHSALYDTWHRSDDLEFVIAARGWSQSVSFGTFEVYKRRFMKTRAFLESRFAEGVKVGSEMIKAVMETEVQREKEESEEEESEGAGVEKVEKL